MTSKNIQQCIELYNNSYRSFKSNSILRQCFIQDKLGLGDVPVYEIDEFLQYYYANANGDEYIKAEPKTKRIHLPEFEIVSQTKMRNYNFPKDFHFNSKTEIVQFLHAMTYEAENNHMIKLLNSALNKTNINITYNDNFWFGLKLLLQLDRYNIIANPDGLFCKYINKMFSVITNDNDEDIVNGYIGTILETQNKLYVSDYCGLDDIIYIENELIGIFAIRNEIIIKGDDNNVLRSEVVSLLCSKQFGKIITINGATNE